MTYWCSWCGDTVVAGEPAPRCVPCAAHWLRTFGLVFDVPMVPLADGMPAPEPGAARRRWTFYDRAGRVVGGAPGPAAGARARHLSEGGAA